MCTRVLGFRWREHTRKQIFQEQKVTIRSSGCSLTLPMLCWTCAPQFLAWQSDFYKVGPHFKASSHPSPLWTHHVVGGLSQWGSAIIDAQGVPPCKRRPAGETSGLNSRKARALMGFQGSFCLLSGSKQVAELSDLPLNFFKANSYSPPSLLPVLHIYTYTYRHTIHGPLHFRLPHFFNTSA